MYRTRIRRLIKLAVLLPAFIVSSACREGVPTERISVSLSNTEAFSYPTVGGDEEGARIAIHPKHALTSEIRRGAGTNWIATYVYQPKAGYIGSDYAQLESFSGGIGATPPDIKRLVIEFDIHE